MFAIIASFALCFLGCCFIEYKKRTKGEKKIFSFTIYFWKRFFQFKVNGKEFHMHHFYYALLIILLDFIFIDLGLSIIKKISIGAAASDGMFHFLEFLFLKKRQVK